MKSAILLLGVAAALAGCGDVNAGNPNGAAYAGSPDSVWSSADNPPKTIGEVSYDPNAPLPQMSNEVTPTPNASPMPYAPAQPMPRTPQR